jgi:hypothetical protein
MLIIGCGAYWLSTFSVKNPQSNVMHQDPLSPVKVTLSAAKGINRKLILRFSRCIYYSHFPLEENVYRSSMYLQFPKSTFSGNIHNQYVCPLQKDGYVTDLEIRQTSSFHLGNGPHHPDHNDYWVRYYDNNGQGLIAKKNNMQLYRRGPNMQTLLVDYFPYKKHGLMINFTPYSPQLEGSGFTKVFDITTFLSENFEVHYSVFTSDFLTNDDASFTAKIDNQFANDFYQAVQGNQDILDHHEIIKQFIINNERVVAYIKAHVEEVKQ